MPTQNPLSYLDPNFLMQFLNASGGGPGTNPFDTLLGSIPPGTLPPPAGQNPQPSGGSGGQTNPLGGSFDLQSFGGPFAAPLLPQQLQVLQGLGNAFDPSAILGNADMRNVLQQQLGGNPIFNPLGGQTLGQQIAPFDIGSAADGFLSAVFGAPVGGGQRGGGTNAGFAASSPLFQGVQLSDPNTGGGGGAFGVPGLLPPQGTPPGNPGGLPLTSTANPVGFGGGGFGGFTPGPAVGAGQATPSPFVQQPGQTAGQLFQQQQQSGAVSPNTAPPGNPNALPPTFNPVGAASDLALLAREGSPVLGPAQSLANVLFSGQFDLGPNFNPGANTGHGTPAEQLQTLTAMLATIPSGQQQLIRSFGLDPSLIGQQAGIQFAATGGILDPTANTIVGENGPELIPPGNQEVIPLTGSEGEGAFGIGQGFPEGLDPVQGFAENAPPGFYSGFGSSLSGGLPTAAASTGGAPSFGAAPVGGAGGTAFTDALLPGLTNAFGTALSAPRFDLTETFQTANDVFAEDLDRSLARTREEFSGLGLGPGSTDREDRLLRTQGDLTNQFRLGQLGLAQNAFESAEGRRLGALGAAPGVASVTDLPFQRRLQTLPGLLAREQQPLNAFQSISENAANRSAGAASLLPSFFNLPFQQGESLFGLGESARSAADAELQRRLLEFQRTQGGGLNQALALLSGSPLQETAFGPSTLSQILGPLGSIFGGFLGGGG